MYDITKNYDIAYRGESPFFTDELNSVLEMTDSEGNKIYGLEKCDWQDSEYPYISAHKTRLVRLFNEKYSFREIGAETPFRWQKYLQTKLNEILPQFDHAYKLYDETPDLDDLGKGYEDTGGFSNTGNYSNSNGSSATANSKFKDTPTSNSSVINNPTTEEVDHTENLGNSSGNNHSEGLTTFKRVLHDEHTLIEVNNLINKYKNLDTEFVNKFNELFIGILTVME